MDELSFQGFLFPICHRLNKHENVASLSIPIPDRAARTKDGTKSSATHTLLTLVLGRVLPGEEPANLRPRVPQCRGLPVKSLTMSGNCESWCPVSRGVPLTLSL